MEEGERISQEELGKRWLEYAVGYLQKTLDKQDVSHARMRLYNSFMKELTSHGSDDLDTVSLRFNFYLRYLDMGVGRGVPIGSRAALGAAFFKSRNSAGQLSKYKRKKKAVYNKPTTALVKLLGEWMFDNYGVKAVQVVEDGLKMDAVEVKIS